jgi:uncharacterized membrane protein YkoI
MTTTPLVSALSAALLAALISLGGARGALADEHEDAHEHDSVTMADLPPEVQATFERESKGGRVEDLRRETHMGGTVIYEGEIVHEGRGAEIEVGANGKVLEREAPHDERAEHCDGR